jgi:hypothetical protein
MGKYFSLILSLICINAAHAVRTFRHPTVAWREGVHLTGGNISIKLTNVDKSGCYLNPTATEDTLVRDCNLAPSSGTGPGIKRYYSAQNTASLESWIVLTNISDINQDVRLEVSEGTLPLNIDAPGISLAPYELAVVCLSPAPLANAGTSPTIGTVTIPNSPNGYLTVPPQASMICGIGAVYRPNMENASTVTEIESRGFFTPYITGSYNITVKINNNRGAMSGSLYYNVSTSETMAKKKDVFAVFPRQTFLLNGGNPF